MSVPAFTVLRYRFKGLPGHLAVPQLVPSQSQITFAFKSGVFYKMPLPHTRVGDEESSS